MPCLQKFILQYYKKIGLKKSISPQIFLKVPKTTRLTRQNNASLTDVKKQNEQSTIYYLCGL